jgi:hypothetical protein
MNLSCLVALGDANFETIFDYSKGYFSDKATVITKKLLKSHLKLLIDIGIVVKDDGCYSIKD